MAEGWRGSSAPPQAEAKASQACGEAKTAHHSPVTPSGLTQARCFCVCFFLPNVSWSTPDLPVLSRCRSVSYAVSRTSPHMAQVDITARHPQTSFLPCGFPQHAVLSSQIPAHPLDRHCKTLHRGLHSAPIVPYTVPYTTHTLVIVICCLSPCSAVN